MKSAGMKIALLFILVISTAVNTQAANEANNTEVLFVVSAISVHIDGDVITLDGIPAVVYFTDRPERKAGHIDADKFAKLWQQSGSFGDEPPNAALSILSAGEMQTTVIEVIAFSVTGDGDSAILRVKAIADTLPEGDFGPASVFFDPQVNNQGGFDG